MMENNGTHETAYKNDLVIVRHGETDGQSSVRFYGSTDIGLSDLGRLQMKRAGGSLAGIAFRTVVTSPLSRSREGAALVLGADHPGLIVEPDFREIDFGDWEGMTAEEIAERDPAAFSLWREKGRLEVFPGGDSRSDFFGRVAGAAVRVFGSVELPALAVLHKGVIKGVLSGLLGRSIHELGDPAIELGSIQRLRRNGGGWELIDLNGTDHLSDHRIPHS